MSFITDAQLNSALHDLLALQPGEGLMPFWNSVITACNLAAYNEILDTMGRRGFSQTVVNQWDRGAEFQTALGLWRCLQELAVRSPDKYGQKPMMAIDRRPELRRTALTIAGVWQDPDTTQGQVTVGKRDDWGHHRRWPRKL